MESKDFTLISVLAAAKPSQETIKAAIARERAALKVLEEDHVRLSEAAKTDSTLQISLRNLERSIRDLQSTVSVLEASQSSPPPQPAPT